MHDPNLVDMWKPNNPCNLQHPATNQDLAADCDNYKLSSGNPTWQWTVLRLQMTFMYYHLPTII